MTRRTVVHYSRKADKPQSHDSVTRAWIASRLARLLDYEYGGEYDSLRNHPGRLYFVPSETLIEKEAHDLGIHDEDDLFGGVMPHAFLTTKAIVHPAVEGGVVPPGWSHAFGARLRDTVLEGYTAFTLDDARRAGTRVLASGAARLKPGDGIAGRGQTVVVSAAELDAAIDALDPESTLRNGVVLEQNLDEVTTFSVGRVRVGELVASYVGTQWLTSDNHAPMSMVAPISTLYVGIFRHCSLWLRSLSCTRRSSLRLHSIARYRGLIRVSWHLVATTMSRTDATPQATSGSVC